MSNAIFLAASGMTAQQSTLDTITANLANADVPAFKSAVAHIVALQEGGRVAGVAVDGTRTVFDQGKLEKSGGACDVAISGEGFFIMQRASQTAYTRAGSFARAADGTLQNAAGWHLAGVRVPSAATGLTVARDGRVFISQAGDQHKQIGRLRLALFAAPTQLDASDATMFLANARSGPATLVDIGKPGGSSVSFGMLERSNVSIVTAMMEILQAQRAYEADAKGVQAADDMWRIANNLQRS